MVEVGVPRVAVNEEELYLAKLADSAAICVVRIRLQPLLKLYN
jgi:hypothetical protein